MLNAHSSNLASWINLRKTGIRKPTLAIKFIKPEGLVGCAFHPSLKFRLNPFMILFLSLVRREAMPT